MEASTSIGQYFDTHGYIANLNVLDKDEVDELRSNFKAFEDDIGKYNCVFTRFLPVSRSANLQKDDDCDVAFLLRFQPWVEATRLNIIKPLI